MRPTPEHRLAALAALLVGAVSSTGLAAPWRIAVSIGPQVAAVRALAPDAVVDVLVQAGQAAESFDPTPRQLAMLQETDLYVTVGMPFERPLRQKLAAAAPGLRVVDGTSGLTLQPMEADDTAAGHAHGGGDPHFWLDPGLMAQHARLIATALGEHYLWLTIVAILGSAISVGYYFKPIIAMYLRPQTGPSLQAGLPYKFHLAAMTLLLILLGLLPFFPLKFF